MATLDIKVVLLGQQGAGKTSLLFRWENDEFDPACRNTVGAGWAAKKVATSSGRTVVLGVWDTAGAERFESLSRMYYRGAQAAVVCMDAKSRSSFEKAQFWVSELQAECSGCRIYLALTKVDALPAAAAQEVLRALEAMHDEPGSSPNAQDALSARSAAAASSPWPALPLDELLSYAASVDARVFATSARSGVGVSALFAAVAEDLADSVPPPPAPPVSDHLSSLLPALRGVESYGRLSGAGDDASGDAAGEGGSALSLVDAARVADIAQRHRCCS